MSEAEDTPRCLPGEREFSRYDVAPKAEPWERVTAGVNGPATNEAFDLASAPDTGGDASGGAGAAASPQATNGPLVPPAPPPDE